MTLKEEVVIELMNEYVVGANHVYPPFPLKLGLWARFRLWLLSPYFWWIRRKIKKRLQQRLKKLNKI
jgi:hypothetical protein